MKIIELNKMITLTIAALFVTSNGLAREPKATLCGDRAEKAARAIYKMNNPKDKIASVELNLVEMDHGDGNMEVWDVLMKDGEGTPLSTPYRIKTEISGCSIVEFSMPGAG